MKVNSNLVPKGRENTADIVNMRVTMTCDPKPQAYTDLSVYEPMIRSVYKSMIRSICRPHAPIWVCLVSPGL